MINFIRVINAWVAFTISSTAILKHCKLNFKTRVQTLSAFFSQIILVSDYIQTYAVGL